MAKLTYGAISSLDGFVADNDGTFDWAEPDAEVHAFVNDLERPAGTHLYGRRLYEVLVAWETIDTDRDQPPFILDFAQIWQAADKIVYSRTLESVSSARTRIEREFDPDSGPRAQGDIGARPAHRRSGARGRGDQGGARRRVPPVPGAGPGRRREAGSP